MKIRRRVVKLNGVYWPQYKFLWWWFFYDGEEHGSLFFTRPEIAIEFCKLRLSGAKKDGVVVWEQYA